MSDPVLLLDGASMWFRSYFGVPSSIKAPDGRPVNAVRGFLDSIATLVTRERPRRLVVCRDDDWRPQWRVDLVPSYKAHRVEQPRPDGIPDVEEVPDDLTPQVGMIMELLDAFGIATAGAPGFEADDVLGTLATREQHDPVVVVSGDRDLLQLVRDEPAPAVRVLYIGRGLAKATKFGPQEVAEQYGVPIDRAGAAYAELALLRGDPSDGLPGVAGIGEKTASTLLARHGSLQGIQAAAEDPKSSLSKAHRTKLLTAVDYIAAAEPVVRVAVDAPVRLSTTTDALPLAAGDPARVAELAAAYGVTSSISRLQSALDQLPG
ncbi:MULTISPECIES: 5'-3' exonuclease [unclassified Mycolicibacterium]|uniref:5'-3' exonuclease n=1 Tax=unclassified Mycolicibacterium TaxID=2636767 RepID=UPI00130C4BF1|nr:MULTISPECIES: 5'-3' exonuclease [unclassified Mycolicibacterium]MUL82507.1 5'-3' exonuclease [Mycolicibacterium sp. CBMA 329]MUL91361.1 5'-3' exonuclease [Mycolicibacterium sp. CBMA 331]MUM01484.1 5'-3' exonuclease [Mycolicibacterium sp. CBMA 334]MUM29695.1 5'-3' exonuclease [Mycolicibacterium sp. CBMA 295]MUM41785.1 5'-3' exonuclease [Mycolicibacterium sp. CBMA 247]